MIEKERIQQEVCGLREQLRASSNEVALLKKELSRLSLGLTEKETELQIAKKQSKEREHGHLQSLQEKENETVQLKRGLEEKTKVIEDILAAMQAEESSRKCMQKNLEMTAAHNHQLESQLKSSHVSLERAESDAACAKEAFAAMRDKVRMGL